MFAVVCGALGGLGAVSHVDAAETATSADAFVDTIGVNTHLSNPGSIYFKQYAKFKEMLIESGIRHIRDGGAGTFSQQYYDRLNELGRAGIHADFTFKPYQTADYLTAFALRLRDSLEAFEAPNEPNITKDPDWAAKAQAFQQLLYTTVKGNPATQNMPVIGPSVIGKAADNVMGDLSAYFDYGNLHNYFGGRPPGTSGWGPDGYGSIEYNKRIGSAVNANKPVMTTETGYCTVDANLGVPENIGGRYEPRIFLEQFNHEIVRTYQYVFLDEGWSAYYANCGLLHADLTPKPAYTAVKSLIGLLADPGGTFTPAPLTYTLSGGGPDVHHVLLEKRNGTYYLAVWREVSSFDAIKRQPTHVSPQTVTVTLPSAPAQATVYVFDDDGKIASVPVASRASSISIAASDRVTFLMFRP